MASSGQLEARAKALVAARLAQRGCAARRESPEKGTHFTQTTACPPAAPKAASPSRPPTTSTRRSRSPTPVIPSTLLEVRLQRPSHEHPVHRSRASERQPVERLAQTMESLLGSDRAGSARQSQSMHLERAPGLLCRHHCAEFQRTPSPLTRPTRGPRRKPRTSRGVSRSTPPVSWVDPSGRGWRQLRDLRRTPLPDSVDRGTSTTRAPPACCQNSTRKRRSIALGDGGLARGHLSEGRSGHHPPSCPARWVIAQPVARVEPHGSRNPVDPAAAGTASRSLAPMAIATNPIMSRHGADATNAPPWTLAWTAVR